MWFVILTIIAFIVCPILILLLAKNKSKIVIYVCIASIAFQSFFLVYWLYFTNVLMNELR